MTRWFWLVLLCACAADDVEPSIGTSGGASSGETEAGSSGSPSSCASHADCDAVDVCAESSCVAAELAAHEVRVVTWIPASCAGGGLEGDADLAWSLELGGLEVARGDWVQGGCPGAWTDRICVAAGKFAERFELFAWDVETDGETLHDRLAFGDDPIPPELLRGSAEHTTEGGGTVRLEFTALRACP